MEIRDIEAFVAVAEELHFGRAAQRLRISQPPLSHRIKQLERNLGVQLFERNTRNVEITQAGKRLLSSAQAVLQNVVILQGAADSFRLGAQGRVRLGFAGASTQRALPLLSKQVRLDYPEIQLELQSQTYVYRAIEMLEAGNLDLAFVRLPVLSEQLEYRVIEIERIVCVVSDFHPLAGKKSVRMAELAQEQFVSLPSDQGSMLQSTMVAFCVTAGFQPEIVQVAPDSATVMSLVSAGVGITITFSSVVSSSRQGIRVLEIDDANPHHLLLALAWRKNDDSVALHRVLASSERALPTPQL